MPFTFKGIVLIHGNLPRVTLFAVLNNGSWSIVNYDVNVNVNVLISQIILSTGNFM